MVQNSDFSKGDFHGIGTFFVEGKFHIKKFNRFDYLSVVVNEIRKNIAFAFGDSLGGAIGPDLKAATFQIKECVGWLMPVRYMEFTAGGCDGVDNSKGKLHK